MKVGQQLQQLIQSTHLTTKHCNPSAVRILIVDFCLVQQAHDMKRKKDYQNPE
jgi:hypothetical protein